MAYTNKGFGQTERKPFNIVRTVSAILKQVAQFFPKDVDKIVEMSKEWNVPLSEALANKMKTGTATTEEVQSFIASNKEHAASLFTTWIAIQKMKRNVKKAQAQAAAAPAQFDFQTPYAGVPVWGWALVGVAVIGGAVMMKRQRRSS